MNALSSDVCKLPTVNDIEALSGGILEHMGDLTLVSSICKKHSIRFIIFHAGCNRLNPEQRNKTQCSFCFLEGIFHFCSDVCGDKEAYWK